MQFFDIYYSNNKIFNLENYGSDITINLSSNLGFFEDLIKNQSKEAKINTMNNDYLKKMKKCIENDFLPSPIFIVYNNI